jgi:thioredoxin-related protein
MIYRDGKVMLGFRNVRFRNANQFDKLVHMAKDMTETITKNFLAHYNKASKDKARAITQEDKRIHKARLTGEKLVEIFLEYIND